MSENNFDNKDLKFRASSIELIIMDVDGTLTDGSIIIATTGDELKRFNVKDGQGIAIWRYAGKKAAILSGRKSVSVDHRARQLSIEYVYQGQTDKRDAYEAIKAESGCSDAEICYIGDDLPDIPIMRRVGLAVAVGNAAEEAKTAAHYVTNAAGGQGAIRETIECIMKAQGIWNKELLRFYR